MSEFNFICEDGSMVRLLEKDIEKWRHVFSGLSLEEELNKISLNSVIRPWMNRKSWFYQLSGYLHKLEKGEVKKMAFEHKDGQGSLFKNDKKTGNQPDYRGTATIDGRAKRISAWIKDGKNGKFLSLSIQDDVPRNEPLPETETTPSTSAYDDVPF